MEILRKYFKERLNVVMGAQKADAKDIVNSVNAEPSTVSRWVNGHSLPSDQNFEELCKFFKVSAEDFLFPKNQPQQLDLLIRGLQILPTLKEHQLRTVVDLMEGFVGGVQGSQPSDKLTDKNKRPS